jgi:hypothetical protein
VFYILDPTEAVRQLFLMPEFAAARGTARTKGVAGTWYDSPHYADLVAATNGELDHPNNSAWDAGGDGVQMTLSRKESTSVFFLRCARVLAPAWAGVAGAGLRPPHTAMTFPAPCAVHRCRDLPEHMVAKACFTKIIMVVPGPKPPSCWDAYLDALGKQLARLAAGKGHPGLEGGWKALA